MTIYISDTISFSGNAVQFNENNPVVGYQSFVKIDDITATYEEPGYLASNLWSPDTYSTWKSGDTFSPTQEIFIDNPDNQEFDYVGIAKHNFGTGKFQYDIEVSTNGGTSWVYLVEAKSPSNDNPIMEVFEATRGILRITITPLADWDGSTNCIIAHIRCGKKLLLQRRLWSDHKPAAISKSVKKTTYNSESGNYLGQIIFRSFRNTNVSQQFNTPSYVRSSIVPFIDHVNGDTSDDYAQQTFFFAWRPSDYPRDVVYGWTNSNIEPIVTQGSKYGGFMSFEFEIEAIA